MSRATDIEVSILLVSYNTRALTCAALDSIARETHEVHYELIAVDNASSDGSAEAIAGHPSRPRCITLDSNLGFARANNLAAAEAHGRYLLLLNPDTEVRNGAVDRLVRFARSRPDALIWGGRTVFADGALNPSSCWGRMTPWNLLCRATGLTGLFPGTELFNGEAYGGWDRAGVREVDIVSGCFLLVERELWEKLGGFDPAFFMYGEEADFCLRARVLGARPVITPEATILHHGGASEATRAGKMVKLLAAKVTLVRRHWSPALVSTGVALLVLWPLSRWLSLAAAAAVTGSGPLRTAAAAWREIWARRGEWLDGFDSVAPAARPCALLEKAS